MKTMAVNVIDRVFLVVYGAAAPTEEDWAHYLDLIERHGLDRSMQLIFTDGGEPTQGQLRQLQGLLDGRTVPVAVVSSSFRVRAKVTALSWINPTIRSFAPTAMRDAIGYLEIPTQRTDLIEGEVRELRGQLGLPTGAPVLDEPPATLNPPPPRDWRDAVRRIVAVVRGRLDGGRSRSSHASASPRSRPGAP